MSTEQTTFEQVKGMIVDRFGVPSEKVTEQMTFEDLGADSLDVVELVMELEDRFNVQFEDEKIEQLSNVGDAVQYIDQLVQ
ncbi:acyl carrier protein [Aerococcaceae bacterium NML191292]|nr:acyl carrier protein [Aerococcaceae bacterium NML210727]MCW6654639.1 acyl carrier protein [Aerococcaceae bacterium NML201296]MCW6658886.1 acyl carrier protein [Aerococcaceae bacterium NML191292]MCW6660649.1 acyl carrier protein [Aerococcaceae bacterium NML201209]MCW6663351.1 acyl carrier protein [Aerococcaceae bacterium NML190073]MCW6664668.1 acyl carrier protein [Aerococcaceae bacterium NML191219]MCW6666653.1 acyl carrier protein [Aerococcaceae bacterium NML190938]MCW6674636.1 acyl carri